MCGVIGYSPIKGEVYSVAESCVAFARLMVESRVRGMHAYGIAQSRYDEDTLLPAPYVKRSHDLDDVVTDFDPRFVTVAHCRYSTSGEWRVLDNNQPIRYVNDFLALNGVIDMGSKAEMEERHGLDLDVDNDAAIFIRQPDKVEFTRNATGSIAAVWIQGQRLRAIRNERRPLWRCEYIGARWYASTRDIFERAGFPGAVELEPHVMEVCR